MVTEPEAELLRRAKAGDTDAFATLCERYRRRVWRVVASVARNPADAEDLAQEAIVRAFCALRTYRAEASFEGWLCRIALNAAHDHHKSAWKRRVLFWERGAPEEKNDTPAVLAPSPHSEAERRDVQKRVRAAVARLNDKERVPIWLIYFEEFSLAEVARLENVPESTIRSRVKAGLKRLQQTLGDLDLTVADDTAAAEIGFSSGKTSPSSSSVWQADAKGCRA